MRKLLLLVVVLASGCAVSVASDPAAPRVVTATAPGPPPTDIFLADVLHINSWAVCVRHHETPGNKVWPYEDGYHYPSLNGYHGAYQFSNALFGPSVAAAEAQGYVPPGTYTGWGLWPAEFAPWWVQDAAAIAQHNLTGDRHWGNRCP